MLEKSHVLSDMARQMQNTEEKFAHHDETLHELHESEEQPMASAESFSGLSPAKLSALAAALRERIQCESDYLGKRNLEEELQKLQRELGRRLAA